MSKLQQALVARATQLLDEGTVARVVGWTKGEFAYDPSPATFETSAALADFVYDEFCGANLSKYLVNLGKKPGKTAVFLKPCDTYSLNELIKEHRVNVYVIGIECQGKADNYKLEALGLTSVSGVAYDADKATVSTTNGTSTVEKGAILLEKCLSCKGKKFVIADETIVIDEMAETANLEAMTASERYAFWQEQLSKCIRCNACRNVCPACTCTKCVFDNPKSGIAAKANDTSFEEQLFHVIRAFHVAGRCTDCGESRVCPQRIPLQLLNRKFIKDIDTLYGDFQAGEVAEGKTPLTSYTTQDVDPVAVFNAREGK